MKSRVIKITIGLLLGLIPLFTALALVQLLTLTAPPTAEPGIEQQRGFSASVIILIGAVMSAITWFGIGLYAVSALYEYLIVQRHARKVAKLRNEGKI